jgi:hypothetical protein
MKYASKEIICLFLLLGFIITVFYKPVSRFIYKKYFHSFILPELQNDIADWSEDINEYVAKMPEIRTDQSIIPNSKVFCTHTLGGANADNTDLITVYLWAHCQEYGFDGQQLIKGMGAIQPVVIYRTKTDLSAVLSHKTVTLRNYSEEINTLFPWYISPHLIGHSPDEAQPISDMLYKKSRHYFEI